MAEDTIQLFKARHGLHRPYFAFALLTPMQPKSVDLIVWVQYLHAGLFKPRSCLQDCQLSVYKPNPRQYVATISQVSSAAAISAHWPLCH